MTDYFIFGDGKFVPDTKRPTFARVLHCSQSPYTDYQRYMTWRGFAGKGDPSVFKYVQKNEHALVLTKPIQQWLFGLLREAAQGSMTEAELISAWANLTASAKAFTDGGSVAQGYADYIQHINEGAKEGLKAQSIMCTGATVKLMGIPYLGSEFHKPVWFQDFEIFDLADPNIFSATYANSWWKIMSATNSLNVGETGERIDPFPKMNGDRDTPWPLMGYGTTRGTIQRDWLEILPDDLTGPAYPYMPYRTRGGMERFDLRNIRN